MKRELGKFETAAALSGEHAAWNIVGVLFLEQLPAPAIIRQALDHLQKRHPLLNVRLVVEGKKRYFESGDMPPIPLAIISRKSAQDWLKIAEDNLNYRFDHSTGPLLKCDLVVYADRGEIILTAQHSIVDGVSMETLFDEVMEIAVRLEAGENVAVYEPLEPLPPVEEFYPADFQGWALRRKILGYFLRQMGDEFRYQFALRGKRKPPIHLEPRTCIIQFHTPAALTTAISAHSRQAGLTLNSLANAAVLLSIQKHLYAGESRLFRYMSIADLRPYLEPVPAEEVVSYIAPLRFTIEVTAGDDLWSLAGRINQQVYTAAKRGEKYLASVMAQPFLQMTFTLKKFRMCTTAISYGNSAKIRPAYGGYQVLGLRGFVSNFGLGPEFSGRVELHDDELWWDMIYLDSDMDRAGAQQIADEINRLLAAGVEA